MESNEFYSQYSPSLEKISDPHWRQFRFVLPTGRFFKVPDVIHSSSVLSAWILKKKPADVYYSVSKFLSPEKVGPRSDVLSENIFLGADLVFDIDREPFNLQSLEQARQEALELLDFLKGKNISLVYLAFSGAKGFHLVCQDPFAYPQENPLCREEQAKEFRKALVEELVREGIEVDSKVTVDTRRILRLPGTINSKTGLECVMLSERELSQPVDQIIKKCRSVNTLSSLIRKEMTATFQVCRNILGLHRWEVRSNPSTFFASFLSSRVNGTPLHVPFIVFSTGESSKAVAVLKRLQHLYSLSDFFLFRGGHLFALSLDALPFKRVEKILKQGRSSNLVFFKKYKKAFVQISPKVDQRMHVFENPPRFVCRVPSPHAPRWISRSHSAFLTRCGIDFLASDRCVGEEAYVLSHCVMES